MIYVSTDYTSKQIDRHAGALRLQLPIEFRSRIDSAVKESLRDMPSKPLRELQTLIAGQVALTLRASNYAKILDDALSEDRAYADHQFQKEQWVHTETVLKPKHQTAVDEFQAVACKRGAISADIESAMADFREYCCHLPPDDERLLMDWAMQVFERSFGVATRKEAA